MINDYYTSIHRTHTRAISKVSSMTKKTKYQRYDIGTYLLCRYPTPILLQLFIKISAFLLFKLQFDYSYIIHQKMLSYLIKDSYRNPFKNLGFKTLVFTVQSDYLFSKLNMISLGLYWCNNSCCCFEAVCIDNMYLIILMLVGRYTYKMLIAKCKIYKK